MSEAIALLVTASLRVTVVLIVACLAVMLLRRSSAAARHLLWMCAIGTAVLTPLLLQVPAWPVLPPDAVARSSAPTDTLSIDVFVPSVPVRDDGASTAPSPSSEAQSAGLPREVYVGAVWLAGFVTVLVYVLLGIAAAARLRRDAERTNASWMDEGRALAGSIGVTRVAFAESPLARVPFVCGVVDPMVVMPPTIGDWDSERCRIVLLHELAHVKRRDCLTHLLAQVACAIYWFHPLAWFAAHRLRIEREQACDDFVLGAGVRPSEYAHHLVAIAKHALPRPSLLASAGVPITHRSQLEGRLKLILDPSTHRTAPRLVRFGTVAFAVVALGIASLRLQAHGSPAAVPAAATSNATFDVTPTQPKAAVSRAVASTLPRTSVDVEVKSAMAEPAEPSAVESVPETSNVSVQIERPRLQVEVPVVVASAAASAPADAAGQRQLEEAFRSGRVLSDLSLTVEWAFRQLNRAEYAVLIGVRIAAPTQSAAARSRVDLIAAATDPIGNVVQNLRDRAEVTLGGTSARTPITYGTSIVLLPGRYTFRVVGREQSTGRLGSADVEITIPNLASQQAQP